MPATLFTPIFIIFSYLAVSLDFLIVYTYRTLSLAFVRVSVNFLYLSGYHFELLRVAVCLASCKIAAFESVAAFPC